MFKSLADIIVYDWLKMTPESHFATALNFFIEDSVKIGFFVLLIIFVMGWINSYFPVSKVRNFLKNKKLFGFEHLLASLLGAATPFCSCSSIPLFVGFLKGGIPLGVTLSFLITSPLINEVAVVIFLGIFGIKVTALYVISGLIVGTVTGALLGRAGLEKYLEQWVQDELKSKIEQSGINDNRTFKERIPEIKDEAVDTFKRIMPYVLAGVAIGGLIHGFIPTGYFEQYMGRDNLLAVPVSVILAIPMYSNASGVIPVIQSLTAKGIPIGTALAFMMAVVGLSFPEAMLLKKVMNLKLVAIYFFTVGISIILTGYFFNAVL